MAVDIFDANYYRSVNPDLAGMSDEDARQHLMTYGLDEGRDFSPYVDLDIYRENSPDLAAAGLTTNRQLYEHLINFGIEEGRRFSHEFDSSVYAANNPDLMAASMDNEQLFTHYRTYGAAEGRVAAPVASSDVATSIMPPISPPVFPPSGGDISPPSPVPVPPEEDAPPISFAAPAADTGAALNASIDVGVTNFNISLNNSVGSSDPNDYYRFLVTTPVNVSLTLSGTVGAEIYRDADRDNTIEPGEMVATVASGLSNSGIYYGGSNISINGGLTEGNYYVRVFSSEDSADYTLNLSANESYYYQPMPMPVY
ncbi:hypothetical protein [[Phormidium] sp. ETS-05]|uniref:hypothetical protein n=1 Tax=[Phormidium] sp. ETS-05 TaxID=222819 RepID=UPI0018EEFA85|nr:hypothetical protein [[Phormidium] sp. ETS-05]